MLLQFSVENYRSFRDRAVLSMEASSDSKHPSHVAQIEAGRRPINLLKSVAVFGANASGKSNLFKAMTAAILIIRSSSMMQPEQPISQIVPFLPDKAYREKPTSFEFVFVVDKIKYVYGFSATTKRIHREYLYAYYTAKCSIIFERDIAAQHEYHFTNASLRRELLPLTSMTSENKLFFSAAATWNSPSIKSVYLWFSKRIDVYTNDYNALHPLFISRLNGNEDEKRFTLQTMREADIGIDAYQIETHELTRDQLVHQMPLNFRGIVSALPAGEHYAYEIKTLHHAVTSQGDEESYVLDINDESDGTKNVFMLSPLLSKAFADGLIVCIDEFDASFHPLLLKYLISTFHDPSVNKGNAQLIISAHTMDLLSLDVYRRDQIYFTQKDPKSAASELYSLDEFSYLSNEDIRNAYLAGRFGAIPIIAEVMDI